MGARLALTFAAVLAVMLCLQPVYARSATAPLPQIELGYSPGSLTPVSSGVPVYTFGDSMWVMPSSQGSYDVQLISPDGTVVTGDGISPGEPLLLHTFGQGDAPGVWTLDVRLLGSLGAAQPVSILLSQATPLLPGVTGESISPDGIFSVNVTTEGSSFAYGFSACVFGSLHPGNVSIPIPPSLGNGNILVILNGSTIVAAPQPLVSEVTNPFDFWVELYQNYSYTEGGASTMVSRDVQVGLSMAVPVSSDVTYVKAPFTPTVAVRPGMFSLRAFFDSSQGLYAAQVPVLITQSGVGWISLQGCGASREPASGLFTVSTRLTDDPSLWPSQVFLMYQEEGVEEYSATGLPAQLAAVRVVAAPWGASFNDSQLSVVPGPSVESSASVDGTLFLAASNYPVEVGISPLGGGPTMQVTVPRAYTFTKVQVNSSRLVVSTAVGAQGPAASGANLTVSSEGAVVARGTVNATGKSVFYLPLGSYSVSGEYKNSTENAASVLAVGGQTTQLALTFPGPSSLSGAYGTILLVSGVVGLVATAYVWTAVYRGRRRGSASRGGRTDKTTR